MGVLQDIITTANEITIANKTNNFIKRKSIKKQKELLRKDISKLTQNGKSIPIQIISEYCKILSEEYKPFGQYLHCKRAISNNSSMVIIFEFSLTTDDTVIASINSTNINESECFINYSYLKNKKPVISFTDSNITLLTIDDNNQISLSLEDQVHMIKNSTVKCIIDDIEKYIDNILSKEEI